MCEKNEKISVIVPVYNAEAFLDDCIRSVIAQEHTDWELILVNDGSKDGSGEICRKYAEADARIQYYEKPNGGVSTARNLGLEKAGGKYISFVDSDDTVTADYCTRLLEKMTESVDMVVLGLQHAYPDGSTRLLSSRIRNGVIPRAEMAGQVIDDGTMSGFTLHSVCAVLYRKDVIDAACLRFDTALKYNEDGYFNTAYFLHCKNDLYVDYKHPVYNYRVNPESATHTLDIKNSKFLDNMARIEKGLLALTERFPDCDIPRQIEKRRATVALSVACYTAQAGDATTANIKAIFDADRTYRTYRVLDFKRMGKGKRLMARAISMRLYFTVALVLRKRYGRK